jgi:hypothetical protein
MEKIQNNNAPDIKNQEDVELCGNLLEPTVSYSNARLVHFRQVLPGKKLQKAVAGNPGRSPHAQRSNVHENTV